MQRARSEFVRVHGGKDMVVAVLGWQRSRPQHVKKYTELYNNRSFDTIQFTANSRVPWISYVEKLREVEALARDISKVRCEGRRLAWHVMSMNGAVTLASVDRAFPHLEAIGSSEGILFDSAPIAFGHGQIPLCVEQAMPRKATHPVLRWMYSAHLARRFTDLEIRRQLGLKVGKYAVYDHFKEHPKFPKTLAFVYSDADTEQSNPKSIAEFVAFNQSCGRDVDELRLADSPHVGHLMKYPEIYGNLIDRFIARIVGGKKKYCSE